MIKAQWLRGVFPALVTPFTKDEEIDEVALRRLISFCFPHVDGFVVVGTTGEFFLLSPEERQRVLEIAVSEVEGRKPIIAGTGSAGTREAIELSRRAEDAGASACLVVMPYFLHPSDKGVYQHFYEVAKSVEIPIILYNIPQMVDRYLPRRVIEDLADIPNIVALKDSSGNLAYMMEVLEFAGDRIGVLVGNDEVVLPALAAGACGMILASAQVFPDIWKRVYESFCEGDINAARELQRSVQKLARMFCRYGGAVAVKAALNMMGIEVGRPRRPLKRVGGALIHEDRAEIRMELEKLGIFSPEGTLFLDKNPLSEVTIQKFFPDLPVDPGRMLGGFRPPTRGSGVSPAPLSPQFQGENKWGDTQREVLTSNSIETSFQQMPGDLKDLVETSRCPQGPPAGSAASNGKSHRRSQELFALEDEKHNRRPGRDFPLPTGRSHRRSQELFALEDEKHNRSPGRDFPLPTGKSHRRSQELFALEDEKHNWRPGRDFPLLHPT
jgi:4-hydroxy-tetrahydrodipicolinate synthase